jgi:prevent-host-death family protein
VKIVPVAEVKAHLSEYLRKCHETPVVVTKNGRPEALLLPAPADEDELERLILMSSPRFLKLLEDAEARIRAGQGMSHDRLWRSLGRASRPRRRGRST